MSGDIFKSFTEAFARTMQRPMTDAETTLLRQMISSGPLKASELVPFEKEVKEPTKPITMRVSRLPYHMMASSENEGRTNRKARRKEKAKKR